VSVFTWPVCAYSGKIGAHAVEKVPIRSAKSIAKQFMEPARTSTGLKITVEVLAGVFEKILIY